MARGISSGPVVGEGNVPCVFMLRAATARRRSTFDTGTGVQAYNISGAVETPLYPMVMVGVHRNYNEYMGPVTYVLDDQERSLSGLYMQDDALHFRLSLGDQMWRVWSEFQNRPDAVMSMLVEITTPRPLAGDPATHLRSAAVFDRIGGVIVRFDDPLVIAEG